LLLLISAAAHPLPAPPPSRPTLAFTGDILLAGKAEALIAKEGPTAPFAGVAKVLSEADCAVGNLECPLSERGEPVEKDFRFRAHPAAAAALHEAGFDVVTLANNHTGDYGRDALLDTLAACRRHGLQTVGAGRDLAAARRSVFLHLGEPPLTIAILGVSNMFPTEFYAGPSRPGTNPAHLSSLTADVRAARAAADVVIVVVHFGVELAPGPEDRHRNVAYAAIDAGADLVVGHHPHVLQGLERRGRGLIAYSLGNFLFPSASARTRESVILTYTPDGKGGAAVKLIPCLIDGFRPRLASPRESRAILSRLATLSKPMGVTISPDGTVR
jgi:poly-gamma-glutamate capsule biosynthesis protein CapA/YwtB (metallophosphatase superfamily)